MSFSVNVFLVRQSKNNMRQYKYEITMGILILLMGLGVLVFFKSFFDTGVNDLTTEILAAFLGSIITVMITMLIIRQQGSIEKAQETAATSKTIIFEKKLELFREFIRTYTKCCLDGKLTIEELGLLEECSMAVSLLSHKVQVRNSNKNSDKEELLDKLSRFILQLQIFNLKYPEEWGGEEWKKYKEFFKPDENNNSPKPVSIIEIMNIMRMELAVDQLVDNEIDGNNYQEENYKFTKKMLRYRKYLNK